MGKKIINKNNFTWQDEDRFKLNYQMVFDKKNPEKEQTDFNEVLKQKQKEWKKELENVRKQSFEKGRKQGHKEGLDTARKEIDKRVEVLNKALQSAHEEWKAMQEMFKPGLLNLVFDITEKILAIPVINGTMRNKLEEELAELFQEMDRKSRPVLWVSADDYEFVETLQKKYAESTGIVLRVSKHCNPGEFQLETNREKVARDFRQMLHDFKESLILPK